MTTLGFAFSRKTNAPAKGVRNGRRMRISIGFEPEMFGKISAQAQDGGISFSEEVLRLVQETMDGRHHSKGAKVSGQKSGAGVN